MPTVLLITWLRRGATLWAAARIVAWLVGISARGATGLSVQPHPAAIVVLTVALLTVDVRRRGETLLIRNLGYPVRVVVGVSTAPALLGEALLAALRVA